MKPAKPSSLTRSAGSASGEESRAPIDRTLEFDFGGKASSASPAPTGDAPKQPAVEKTAAAPVSHPVEPSAPTSISQPLTPATPVQTDKPATPIKEASHVFDRKLRIHHTATPGASPDPNRPVLPTPKSISTAVSGSASHNKIPFSASSIKITDLTGELNPPAEPSAPTKPVHPAPAAPSKPTTAATPTSFQSHSAKPAHSTPGSSIPHTSVSATPSSSTPLSSASHAGLEKTKSFSYLKPEKPEKKETKPEPAGNLSSFSSNPATPSKETTPYRSNTMATTPPTVSDFRKNAERQAREQKAVGSVLAWAGYGLLGGLILVTVLAGFGGYTLFHMIEKQSVTVAQLDARYSEQLTKQDSDIKQLREEVDKLNEQLATATTLMAKQQEQLKRTATATDENSVLIKTTRREISDLRRRMDGTRPTR